MATRLFILGLDGAGYDLVSRLSAEGVTPNLAELARAGSFGPLRSTVPPITGPSWLGLAYYTGRDYEKAIESLRESLRLQPNNVVAQRIFAAALAQAGKLDEARAALERSLALSSGLSAEALRHALPYRDPANFEHFAEGLRKAGWQG